MNKRKKATQKANRFKKLLDDAGRRLQRAGEMDFLDDLPPDTDRSTASVPFPYGAPPENRNGWK